MDTLGDIAGDRIVVECLSCRRRGVYATDGLVARFGPTMQQLDALRHLSGSCRHQRRPGSPPARKYESACQARLILPPPKKQIVPTPIQRGLNVEAWTTSGSIEWHLATVWSFELGHLVLDAAAKLYPAQELTLRQACRVIAKREKPE
ncbi:hypothetical protein FV232_23305 [Methylobacterium sp. WL30]|uniref:hypothetical protein n=1 Tax=unclassified Methylobacterium TaxID=2615210 RepID=UPI0011C7ECC7|nr:MULTISPECIES: hypothetical protein [unclassified Methylobacterium]TXN41457.1 hypothetical protein FV225_02280 [Methylobacterium sp. WL93]TXN50553.1 hypothetical protein FV227_11395 [Methylobacterium sp. WL119]TXN63425.1 hypothetical protein FV232_23305 [Methylobacterium sp. WL30]